MAFRLIRLSTGARKMLQRVQPFSKAQTLEAMVHLFVTLSLDDRRVRNREEINAANGTGIQCGRMT